MIVKNNDLPNIGRENCDLLNKGEINMTRQANSTDSRVKVSADNRVSMESSYYDDYALYNSVKVPQGRTAKSILKDTNAEADGFVANKMTQYDLSYRVVQGRQDSGINLFTSKSWSEGNKNRQAINNLLQSALDSVTEANRLCSDNKETLTSVARDSSRTQTKRIAKFKVSADISQQPESK